MRVVMVALDDADEVQRMTSLGNLRKGQVSK